MSDRGPPADRGPSRMVRAAGFAGVLLSGCLAALITVSLTVAVVVLAFSLATGGGDIVGGPAEAAGLAFAATGVLMLTRLPFALPLAAVAAWHFHGGLGVALAAGALAGAALELALAVLSVAGLPDLTNAPFLSGFVAAAALGGAAFAWPVWHLRVAPRRRRAGSGS